MGVQEEKIIAMYLVDPKFIHQVGPHHKKTKTKTKVAQSSSILRKIERHKTPIKLQLKTCVTL